MLFALAKSCLTSSLFTITYYLPKNDAVAHDILKEYGSTAHPERGFAWCSFAIAKSGQQSAALRMILNSYHAKRGARFRTLCAPAKHKKRRLLASFRVWLGHRDSNPGSDGVRVRCLTAWRCPNVYDHIIIAEDSSFVNNFFQKNKKISCISKKRIK